MRARDAFSGMSPRRIACLVLAALALLAAVLAGLYWLGTRLENAGEEETRGDLSTRFVSEGRVTYNGTTYAKRSNLTSILVLGVDRAETQQSSSFRQGGQADFLLLMLLNHDDKTVRRLQIDRDTMAEIVVLGVLGNISGTRVAQICLSHGFGDGGKQSSIYTLESVERLLGGVDVDYYMSFELNAIGALNDLLGGVTVTVQDDFSAYDPSMTPGETLTLTASQAELFVRSRIDVGDGTNASRMLRQRAYLQAASEALAQRMQGNEGFVGTLFDGLKDIMVTNMSRGRLINEANRAYGYEMLPLETLEGDYATGDDGFVEFHADAEAAHAWAMDAFYAPVAQ